MARLIDDLLMLSRLSRNEPEKAAVDLTKMAEDIVAGLREASPEREVKVVIQPGLLAYGDAGMLRIALNNLLGNAWKYTALQERPEIRVEGSQSDKETELAIHDNGVGFDMQYKDKLFGVFQRLHHRDEFPGTGIGLATVDRVIKRHGGRAWAEGSVGKGASFYFTLPKPPIKETPRKHEAQE